MMSDFCTRLVSRSSTSALSIRSAGTGAVGLTVHSSRLRRAGASSSLTSRSSLLHMVGDCRQTPIDSVRSHLEVSCRRPRLPAADGRIGLPRPRSPLDGRPDGELLPDELIGCGPIIELL